MPRQTEPVQIVELIQPRCARRFGDAIEPYGPPALTKANLDAISAGELDRAASVLFHAQVGFPSPWSAADGVIWEQGGAGDGAYLGVTDGALVFRAGNGSTAAGTEKTAMVSVDGSALAGLTVRIRAEISVGAGSVTLSVFRLDGRRLLEARHVAPAGFTLWAGTDGGAIGRSSSPSGVPVGVSHETFTGTIGEVHFYAGDFSGGCTATTAMGPRCYNTWGTCLARKAYDGSGEIAWRFAKPGQALPRLYRHTGETVGTDPLPLLSSVSVRSSKINVAAIRNGEKPLGVTGGCTVTLSDAAFDDYVGDWYVAERRRRGGSFWAKWTARNPYFGNMRLRIHEGFAGQPLEEMSARLYLLDSVDGPDSDGRVTLTGVDPLRLTDSKRATFPRETEITLKADLDATGTVVRVVARDSADLADSFGNTARRYITLGSEIIGYDGYADEGDGIYLLSGVGRGELGTEAGTHDADDACQRAGRYAQMDAWAIAHDLIVGHTAIPAEFVDAAAWEAEAGVYLQGYQFSRTVSKPTAVNALLGELMRDGTFYLWWDERAQTIPLKAVRPEVGTAVLTDATDFVAGSLKMEREPDERISRVFVYYNPIDPTASDDATNFRHLRGRIDADAESEDAGAEVLTKTIYSRWIVADTHADEMLQRLLARFSAVPRYLTATLVGDGHRIGEVVDVTTRLDVDSEGAERTRRWQIISAQQVRAGETTQYRLQEFIYQGSRYAGWMADDAADHSSDVAAESLVVGWWSDDDGLMADGSEGYNWQ